MTPLERVLARLPDARRNCRGWVARCPAHDDRTPSLSVADGDDGRALLRCHAGCTTEAVVEALGLRMADLMPARQPDAPRRTARRTTRRTTQRTTTPTGPSYSTAAAAIQAASRSVGGEVAGQWAYQDADGREVMRVARYELPAGRKQYRPVHAATDGWRIGDPPDRMLPLYCLPELVTRSDDRVYVTEGERCADAARSIGLLSTTSAHGSSAAARTDWSPLAGRDVAILPDADQPGERYAADVAGILARLDPPARVRTVRLPGLVDGGDIVDYLDARDSIEPEAIRDDIMSLVAAAPELDLSAVAGGPILVRLADVEPRAIDWLWPLRIPMGRLSLLVGRPGEGKSFLSMDLAARITTGSPWPDGSGHAPRGSVLIVSAEDDPGDTIRPRLDAHHADATRVHLLSGVRRLDEDGQPHEVMYTLADVEALEQALRRCPDCRLVVIDPIGSFLGGATDAHRDNEVRAVLAPVARLAERYGPAVLVVAHRRKGSADHADDTALGSRAFTGIARTVWHLSRDPHNKQRRLLLPGKNNLAPEGDGMAFCIGGEPARLVWEHEPVRMTADEGLAAECRDRRPGPEPDARDAAAEWLRELLADGPMNAAAIRAEAQTAGYAWRTVHRAKDGLGIRPRKGPDGWTWST